MTIKQYKPGMGVEVGQWVNLKNDNLFGFAGQAALVMGKTDRMLQVSILGEGEDAGKMSGERYKLLASTTFVSDTKEEAIRVREASSAEVQAHEGRKAALIATLV